MSFLLMEAQLQAAVAPAGYNFTVLPSSGPLPWRFALCTKAVQNNFWIKANIGPLDDDGVLDFGLSEDAGNGRMFGVVHRFQSLDALKRDLIAATRALQSSATAPSPYECPKCGRTRLVMKDGKFGPFLACPDYGPRRVSMDGVRMKSMGCDGKNWAQALVIYR